MGNVAEKLQDVGEAISDKAGRLAKEVNAMLTTPKKPLPMPNFGDGRSADQLRTAAEMMYGMDTKTCVNIAVLGPEGPSKTGLINSLRYISDCKPDIGVFAPKNIAIQYQHCDPAYEHVRFWDVVDNTGSFEERCLYAFDCIILLTGEVLRPDDVKLIKQANTVKDVCPILVVRTDMDMFIDKEFGLEPESARDVITGKDRQGPIIKENMNRQLIQGGIGQCLECCGEKCAHQAKCIFLVSSPGILAARAVNLDGIKYIWDEFDFMKRMLDCVALRRY